MSFLNKTQIFKDKARVVQVIGASLVGLLFLGVFLYCYFTYGKELTEIISDPERFKALVESFNNWDRVAFVAIRAFHSSVVNALFTAVFESVKDIRRQQTGCFAAHCPDFIHNFIKSYCTHFYSGKLQKNFR